MKIAEHKISRVCKRMDPARYRPIANSQNGYGKLCCFAVDMLRKNSITTSYENICVALWLMFPEAERLHLTGFDDMPDTDFMEKLIKLRSTAKAGGYLMGGNYKGRTSEYGNPWQLTKKGELYAIEAAEILAGKLDASTTNKVKEVADTKLRRGTINYRTQLAPILESGLFKRFMEAGGGVQDIKKVLPESTITAPELCAALELYYPSDSLKSDVRKKKDYFLNDVIEPAVADGVSAPELVNVKRFLSWIDSRRVIYE